MKSSLLLILQEGYIKSANFLFNKKAIIISFSLWVLFQILWSNYFSYDEWISDSGLYQYYATECYNAGTLYPNYDFYYGEYIHNPGWVNMLILWYAIFGSFHYLFYLLIFFNVLSFIILWYIAKELSSNEQVPYLTAYLYMILPAFSTTFNFYWSEPSYLFFSLLSFLLVLKQKKRYLFLAGMSLAVAYWIRPVAIAVFIAAVIYIIFSYRSWQKLALYCIGLVIVSSSVAKATHVNFPDYIWTGNTGGVNLIMVAHDNATGRWDYGPRNLPGMLSETNRPVYVSGKLDDFCKDYNKRYTYHESDSIYMARSMEWIKEHPFEYLSLMPYKFAVLFSGSARMLIPDYMGYRTLKALLKVYQSCVIIPIVFIALLGLFFPFWKDKKLILLVPTIVFYTGLTMISIVDARFNWAFLPFILLFSSITISSILDSFLQKQKSGNK